MRSDKAPPEDGDDTPPVSARMPPVTPDWYVRVPHLPIDISTYDPLDGIDIEEYVRLVREKERIDEEREAERNAAVACAQQAGIETRDLAIQHKQALEKLRKESDAAAHRYFLLGIAVGAISIIISWLLTGIQPGQVLQLLLHR